MSKEINVFKIKIGCGLWLSKVLNVFCGYAVVKSANWAVLQFGVLQEKRNRGYGCSLFHWFGKRHSTHNYR